MRQFLIAAPKALVAPERRHVKFDLFKKVKHADFYYTAKQNKNKTCSSVSMKVEVE